MSFTKVFSPIRMGSNMVKSMFSATMIELDVPTFKHESEQSETSQTEPHVSPDSTHVIIDYLNRR